jgi:N-acetylmuramoyl-L-alanine amidase
MKKILILASLWSLSWVVVAQSYAFDQRELVKTVVIDAGHGGHDSGCSGHHHLEKNNNLEVALQLGALIQQRYPQIQVIYTRSSDVFIPLEERAEIANRAGADLFMSVHCNYNGSRKHHASGTETYYFNSDNQADAWLQARADANGTRDPSTQLAPIRSFRSEKSRKMAFLIENAMQNVTRRHSRGVKVDALKVLYLTKMPSVLSEIGFLTDAQEGAYVSSQAGQSEIAQALFQAFEAYIDPLPPVVPVRTALALVSTIPLRTLPSELASIQGKK